MSGYALIYRTLLNHPAFRNEGEAMAFAWLIVRAAWRPCRVRYKGHIIELKRGQLAVSIRDFATAMDRPKGWVERLISRLKNEAMIETRNEADGKTGVTIISVCNYGAYQVTGDDNGTAGGTVGETRNGTRPRQKPDTEQRREEDNNQRTRVRIPADWAPVEFGAKSQSRKIVDGWSRNEFERQLETFKAHHRREGSKFFDWQDAWSTWVLNSVRFAPRQSRSDHYEKDDLVAIIHREYGLEQPP